MPELFSIHAIVFNPPGDLSSRIAPPYDVLDEGPKQKLLARDPHNIVKIDLPVTPPKTVGPDEAYRCAADTFRGWLDRGVLRRLDEPAVVAYEQVFTVGGRTLRRRGLFAALGVEPFNRTGGGIFRHEHTIQGGLDDRLKLMNATRAQLSPVFGTFADPRKLVSARLDPYYKGEPDFFGTTDHDGVEHRCWLVGDANTIDQLADIFRGTDVFIADGHHRYTTALNYARAHPDEPAAQRCLFVLVAAEDPGMIVLPTHRVVRNMRGFDIDEFLDALRPVAEVTETADPPRGQHAIGIFDGDTRRQFVAAFKSADPLAESHPDKPEVWRQLDVAICQHAIVDGVLRDRFGGDAVSLAYTADQGELRTLTAARPGQVGLILQPTPLESVMGVSIADEVMPPKSTFFYPKLATGLVINPLT